MMPNLHQDSKSSIRFFIIKTPELQKKVKDSFTFEEAQALKLSEIKELVGDTLFEFDPRFKDQFPVFQACIDGLATLFAPYETIMDIFKDGQNFDFDLQLIYQIFIQVWPICEQNCVRMCSFLGIPPNVASKVEKASDLLAEMFFWKYGTIQQIAPLLSKLLIAAASQDQHLLKIMLELYP